MGAFVLMICWHMDYIAVLPPLLGCLDAFSGQPSDRVGIVYWPRRDDDLAEVREGFAVKV